MAIGTHMDFQVAAMVYIDMQAMQGHHHQLDKICQREVLTSALQMLPWGPAQECICCPTTFFVDEYALRYSLHNFRNGKYYTSDTTKRHKPFKHIVVHVEA